MKELQLLWRSGTIHSRAGYREMRASCEAQVQPPTNPARQRPTPFAMNSGERGQPAPAGKAGMFNKVGPSAQQVPAPPPPPPPQVPIAEEANSSGKGLGRLGSGRRRIETGGWGVMEGRPDGVFMRIRGDEAGRGKGETSGILSGKGSGGLRGKGKGLEENEMFDVSAPKYNQRQLQQEISPFDINNGGFQRRFRLGETSQTSRKSGLEATAVSENIVLSRAQAVSLLSTKSVQNRLPPSCRTQLRIKLRSNSPDVIDVTGVCAIQVSELDRRFICLSARPLI
eukprot:Filipodium_phascolosomae@DN1794_c0_g1_i1.p1